MLCILYVGTVPTLCILNVGTVPTLCVFYVGTVPMLCILDVGTVPTLCILNVGTVPIFSSSELVPPQWPPQPCRQWAQRRRGPKIVIFSRTEGCCSPSELVFLNFLLNHVVKELNVEEVLKSSILVVQKTAAPKNGVEFRQGSIGTIRSSLAASCDLARCRGTSHNIARLLLMVSL